MGVMVSEVYDALVEAGASPEKARAAAEAIPATEQLATKQDLAQLETRIFKTGIGLVGPGRGAQQLPGLDDSVEEGGGR